MRFSGEGEKASELYWVWRKWSKAWLVAQRARGTDATALGPMLFTLLDGPAERALRGVEIDDLEIDGGEELVYEVLDERFPRQEAQDIVGEVLDDMFRLRIDRNERAVQYTMRCREVCDRGDARGH